MTANNPAPQAEFQAKFKPLFEPSRYKVFYGGRGGLKSWSFAQALLLIASNKKTHVLCTRELQNSISESVHKLLCTMIERLELQSFYTITQNKITGANGSTFIFEGMRSNTDKIKSMEGINIVWCEEAESISEKNWDILTPTIRAEGSEIWVSFNPFDEMDATYQKFVAPWADIIEEEGLYRDDQHIVVKTGWRDNPWMSDALTKDRLKCKAENYTKYLHIWEGEPTSDYEDSIIPPDWINAAIDAHKKLKWENRGIRTIGFDPADGGNDAKAYIERYGSLVTSCEQWKGGDLEDATEKVYRAALSANCNMLIYDSIGIGAGARIKFNQLKGSSLIEIVGFCGSERPANPYTKYQSDRPNRDVFKNRRAQGYWYLRDRFEATYRAVVKGEKIDPENLISLDSNLPYLKQLRSELSKIQRKQSRDSSLIQIESKQDMKARGVKSPNIADALMYAFFTVKGGGSGMKIGKQRFGT